MGELSDAYRKWRAEADNFLAGGGDAEAQSYLRSPGLRPEVRRARSRALPALPRLPAYVADVPARELPRYREIPRAEAAPFPFMDNVDRVAVVRPLPRSHPAGYGDFASYANSTMGLLARPQPQAALAPEAAHGLAPEDAGPASDVAEVDNQAWNQALARARAAILEEDRAAGRRIPRPGNPAVATFVRDLPRRRR